MVSWDSLQEKGLLTLFPKSATFVHLSPFHCWLCSPSHTLSLLDYLSISNQLLLFSNPSHFTIFYSYASQFETRWWLPMELKEKSKLLTGPARSHMICSPTFSTSFEPFFFLFAHLVDSPYSGFFHFWENTSCSYFKAFLHAIPSAWKFFPQIA